MQVHELKYFAAVIDSGSIGRAAAAVGVSQPALTKCIRRLEQRLCVTLLERGRRGVIPTAYGQSLYVHAKSITAEIVRATAEIEEMSRTSAGMLVVGALPSQTAEVLPEAAIALTRAQPGLRIRIVEKQRADLLAGLRQGEFDLIVSVIDPDDTESGIAAKVLFRDRAGVVVRRGHPFALCRSPDRLALAAYPWAVPPPGTGRRIYVERLFGALGVPVPRNIVECHSVSFVKAVVLRSDYVGILPTDAPGPEQRAGEIVALDLDRKPPLRSIGVIYRTDHPMTEAALALVKLLRDTYARKSSPAHKRVGHAT